MNLQLLIILLYFLILIIIGFVTKKFSKTSTDFLIAGRNLGLVLCTVTVLGEWLGGMSTVGTAEKAYTHGFFPMWYNISTATGMVLFGYLLAKRYRESNLHTVGEMLEKLFDRRVRIITSLCFVVAFIILSYIQLQAVGGVTAQLLDLDYNLAVIIAGILVTLYVYFGGMKSIALTNLIHVLLLYTTLITVFCLTLVRIGGFGGLFAALGERLAPEEVAALRNPFSQGLGPMLAWLLGGILAGFASQASIQPVFAARDIRTARRSSYLSALFIAPVGIMVSTLGLAVRAGAAGGPPPTVKETLPFLLMRAELLPSWLSGLAMAGIVAAILSTIAPVMFAVSTIITKDLYQLIFDTRADDRRLFRMSKLFVVAIGLLSIPLAIFLRGRILDTAYITYAIRGAAAIAVLVGIFWVRDGRSLPPPQAISTAMVASTAASLIFVIFNRQITALLGFTVDKVYASIFFTLASILLVTVCRRRAFSGSGAARGRRRR
jgi:SSS family solute:Na+ symporter